MFAKSEAEKLKRVAFQLMVVYLELLRLSDAVVKPDNDDEKSLEKVDKLVAALMAQEVALRSIHSRISRRNHPSAHVRTS